MSRCTSYPSVVQRFVATELGEIHLHLVGDPHAEPLVLVHGNTSDGRFWYPLMQVLSNRYRVIAPDLNGFGKTRLGPIRAENGVKGWAQQVVAVMEGLGISNASIITSSMGGIIGWQLLASFSNRLNSLIQISPGSPYGFGGTQGASGKLNAPDAAGSGAGMVNPQLLKRLQSGDRTENQPVSSSPRWLLHHLLMNGAEMGDTELFLDAMLSMDFGAAGYPGDIKESQHWPGFAPGKHGVVNALSPIYLKGLAGAVLEASCKIPILWLRGSEDQIVSNASLSDPASQGCQGLRAKWPGLDVAPPQPMLDQIRELLERYQNAGGRYTEMVLDGLGHCPYIEDPQRTANKISSFLEAGLR